MLIALVLFLIGILVILANPILGLIPGILLIVLAIVVGFFAVLGKGLTAVTGVGSTKECPECRSKVPSDAVVCRYCSYRFPG